MEKVRLADKRYKSLLEKKGRLERSEKRRRNLIQHLETMWTALGAEVPESSNFKQR